MGRACKAFSDKGFFGLEDAFFPTERAVYASVNSMKKAFCLAVVLLAFSAAISQVKPLTQTEYVKMLYDLQKAPESKGDIIAALRSRGIDFAVTDGILGLTRSKSGNDEELRRALQEADRRRQNPEATKLPDKAEADALLAKTRQNTLDAVNEMPDFVVKQLIQRSVAYAGTGTFRNNDNLIVAVSYRSTGEEDYKLLSQNGLIFNNPQAKSSYEEVGGTSSTGEFVNVLATIFKPESETHFNAVETDVLRGKKTIVFEFSITRDLARQMITAAGLLNESTITGMSGRLWIDTADARVIRIESEATEIPESFSVRKATRSIDYDWVKITDGTYLLPTLSDVRLTIRDHGKLFETRNLIRFKNYQKYGTDVTIVEEDNAPPPENKKPNP
jgi:hypothetical protein